VWTPPTDRSEAGFAAALSALGARGWQTRIVAPLLAKAFADHPDTDG
jgi:ribonuclease D